MAAIDRGTGVITRSGVTRIAPWKSVGVFDEGLDICFLPKSPSTKEQQAQRVMAGGYHPLLKLRFAQPSLILDEFHQA